MTRNYLTVLLMLVSITTLNAQTLMNKKNYKTWSIGFGGGYLIGRSDVKQYDWFPTSTYANERRFGFHGELTKQISPALGFQGMILRGNATGTLRSKNQYYDADIWDYSLNAVINLRNLLSLGVQKKYKFSYSFTLGAGLAQFKTKLKQLDGPSKNQTINSYGYGEFGGKNSRTTESFLTLGAGVKYAINKDFDLGIDLYYRSLNSDKLDAVIQDGNNDSYIFGGVGITYHLGKRNSIPYERVDPTNKMYEQLQALQNKVDSITKDGDGNGIPDIYERKDATASTPIITDTDRDGVTDDKDKEPFSNKEVKVDPQGKELDDDDDGIPNSKDLEPNTPKGNLVNFQGKTIVAENKNAKDDQFDFNNQTPIPGNKNVPTNGGLNKSAGISLLNRVPVYFNLNNAAVSSKYNENLAQIALFLKANPDVKLRITGHTDATASANYNYQLGLRRANIVKQYLVHNFRIKADRIIVESMGETELLSPTINEINRRVEVEIIR